VFQRQALAAYRAETGQVNDPPDARRAPGNTENGQSRRHGGPWLVWL